MIRNLCVAALVLLASAAAGAAPALTTEAERSGFLRTGRYDEVLRLCGDLERAEPRQVRCVTFGRSAENRPMVALVVSADGVLDPAAARRSARPVIFIQSGIHGGEIEGKDAIFIALRELLSGKLAPGALGKMTLVLIPVFNVDGHERRSRWNRPNQRGPEEAGFRATAQNLNLNRDYVKADAPEMRAMLDLWNAWDPVLLVDIHTTDGAKFEHDLAITMAPVTPRGDGLETATARLSAAVQQRLTALGHLPLPFYPSFRVADDPSSGFDLGDAPPRFSEHYAAARNRIGVLVETHSWKTYARRVAAAHDAIAAILERGVADAGGWRAAADAADRAATRLAGHDVALIFDAGERARTIDFRGYAYRIEKSEISGGPIVVYDESRPQVWRVPLHDRLEPKLVVRAPGAGYVVPVAWSEMVAPRLRQHGIRFEVLPALPAAELAAFHIDKLSFGALYEGRTPARVEGSWRPERRDLLAGALYVPIDQPAARLILHIFEPAAPDSLVAWGTFDAAFQRKEYIEDYVLEPEARRMLAADPSLRTAFEGKLREDPAFAASPEQRLSFFHQRHPSWEAGTRVAPVLRADQPPR